jgi:hypothetical protein
VPFIDEVREAAFEIGSEFDSLILTPYGSENCVPSILVN